MSSSLKDPQRRHVKINARVKIPMDEISLKASLASGPGGQHVNKTATKVELRFDLDASPSLEAGDKALEQADTLVVYTANDS